MGLLAELLAPLLIPRDLRHDDKANAGALLISAALAKYLNASTPE